MLIMYRHKQTSDINLLDRKKCFQINRSSATEQMFRTFFAKKISIVLLLLFVTLLTIIFKEANHSNSYLCRILENIKISRI